MSEKSVKRYTAQGKWALILVTETNPELMTNQQDIFVRASDYDALIAALERISHTSSDCISRDTARSALKASRGDL